MSEKGAAALVVELLICIIPFVRLHVNYIGEYMFLRVRIGISRRNLILECYLLGHFSLGPVAAELTSFSLHYVTAVAVVPIFPLSLHTTY